jgi:hypothetical protein
LYLKNTLTIPKLTADISPGDFGTNPAKYTIAFVSSPVEVESNVLKDIYHKTHGKDIRVDRTNRNRRENVTGMVKVFWNIINSTEITRACSDNR